MIGRSQGGGTGCAGGTSRDDVVDLREVVVEHRADIFRYARSFCRNDADAEDLAQTAVVRALASGREVRNPERAKWYLLADRAQPRHRPGAGAGARRGGAVGRGPRRGVGRSRTRRPPPARREHELPRAAFADLPRVHQEVLRLRFVEELDHAAIAERLHTTEQAARQRVYRAMQALRAITQHSSRPVRPRQPLDAFRRRNCVTCTQLRRQNEVLSESQPARSARAPISTEGWRRRARARASIWRTRSRLRLTSWPTSSGVRGSPRSSPKRSVRM